MEPGNHIFVYDGSGSVGADAGAVFQNSRSTWLFFVDIHFGTLVNTIGAYPLLSHIAPTAFPPLPPDVKIKATWGHVGGDAIGVMKLMDREKVFSSAGVYLGDRFFFRTDDHSVSEGTTYEMKWSMESVEFSYGGDLIQINALSGSGGNFSFGD